MLPTDSTLTSTLPSNSPPCEARMTSTPPTAAEKNSVQPRSSRSGTLANDPFQLGSAVPDLVGSRPFRARSNNTVASVLARTLAAMEADGASSELVTPTAIGPRMNPTSARTASSARAVDRFSSEVTNRHMTRVTTPTGGAAMFAPSAAAKVIGSGPWAPSLTRSTATSTACSASTDHSTGAYRLRSSSRPRAGAAMPPSAETAATAPAVA